MQDVHVDLIVQYNPGWIKIILGFIKMSKKMDVSVCDFILKTFISFCCLGGLSSHSSIFKLNADVTYTGDGLQILTCFLHSWPLSSEGSLKCHTYWDKGHLFIMVSSEEPWQ